MVSGRTRTPRDLRWTWTTASRWAIFWMSALLICVSALADGDQKSSTAPKEIPEGKTCLDCHKSVVRGKVVHFPVGEDCGACHEQEEPFHKFSYPETGGALCLDCHELDLAGSVHKPVKEGNCGGCHDPHSSDQPKLMRSAMAEVCGRCHTGLTKAPKAYQHGPYAGGLCIACHQPHAGKGEMLLVAEGPALCLGCHEEMAPAEGEEGWHAPVLDDCTTCHHPHETDVPSMLLSAPNTLCVECHDEIGEAIKQSPVPHKAVVEERACANCHDPHRSELSSLLRAPSAKLCARCHDRTYPRENGRPVANIVARLEEFPVHHGPVREENCEGCHQPHGSANFRLLKKAYPAKFYTPFKEENYDLCFSCHEKGLVLQEKSTLTNFRDGERNLHFLHVNRRKGRTCRACHAVHASGNELHLRDTTPFGTWELPVGFKRTPTGGTCTTGCHVEQTYSRGTR